MHEPNPQALRSTGDGGIVVPSPLWIDRDDVHERISDRLRRGEIDDATASTLTHFADEGYAVVRPDVEASVFDELQASIEGFWRDKPHDLAYAYTGPARRMSDADEARDRHSRYRIHDVHSHCEAALALYLDRQLFELVELILGEAAVAIQSLYFEYGSQQLLHRDPVVVPLGAPGHMVAAWIALEDIGPECGPLVYVPRSHRLPYYELAPGEYMYDGSRMGPEVVEAGLAWEAEQEKRHGLEPRLFTARRGDVLLWHASLRHGGSAVEDEKSTRKSFVVHYSSQRTYPERSITVTETIDGEDRPRVLATRELLERDGRRGFQNPMLGQEPSAS